MSNNFQFFLHSYQFKFVVLFLANKSCLVFYQSHAASEGSRVDLPSIWHRLVKARLRLSERRAKRVWAMPSVSSLDEVNKSNKSNKSNKRKRDRHHVLYIYNIINNYTYSIIIYINALLLFSKTGVAFVAFVACVAASKQSATSATSATSKNERKSIFAVLTH